MMETLMRNGPDRFARAFANIRKGESVITEAQSQKLRAKYKPKPKPQPEIGDDHEHVFTMKWDNTYRSCACGLKQWRLACWTASQWRHYVNNPHYRPGRREENPNDTYYGVKNIFDQRKDLDPQRFAEGINKLYLESPHRVRSYSLIPEAVLNDPIVVVGAGGIGSWCVVALHKMGFTNITVYDPQNVDEVNIGTQLYGRKHTLNATSKVSALDGLLNGTLGVKSVGSGHGTYGVTPNGENYIKPITALQYAITPNSRFPANAIVISAVDAMSVRKVIWENCKRDKVRLLIDGRMGAEQALLYSMSPGVQKDVQSYEKTLYEDEKAVQEPCTARATVYTGMLLGAYVAKAVKDFVTKNAYPRVMHWNIRDHQQQVWTAVEK